MTDGKLSLPTKIHTSPVPSSITFDSFAFSFSPTLFPYKTLEPNTPRSEATIAQPQPVAPMRITPACTPGVPEGDDVMHYRYASSTPIQYVV